jgi:hypothetical protein
MYLFTAGGVFSLASVEVYALTAFHEPEKSLNYKTENEHEKRSVLSDMEQGAYANMQKVFISSSRISREICSALNCCGRIDSLV